MNYDSTLVGVPYIRCNGVTIQYPKEALPIVTVSQEWAVKLENSAIEILAKPAISFSFELDLINNATTAIPMINPDNGALLGINTNLQDTLIDMASIIREKQLIFNI